MNSRPTHVALAAAAGGAAIAAFAGQATATARTAPAPTRVAVVDLVKVIERLDERSDWEVQISALGKKVQEEFASRRKAIETMADELEKASEADRTALRDKIAFEQLRFEQWEQIKKIEIDRERALMWQSMYRNIRTESQKLADAEGWDIVMVNDGVTEIQLQRESKSPLEQQAQEQIVRRRVLYAGKSTDVTDQLVVRMNNARAANAGKPAGDGTAPAPAPAPAAPAK
jgi:Skp family chaperone for outer membrane proteins